MKIFFLKVEVLIVKNSQVVMFNVMFNFLYITHTWGIHILLEKLASETRG